MGRTKELAVNTGILTAGKLCTQFVSFLLLPLYTALLRPEEYGTVDLIMSYITLLLPLVCWQFDMGIFRFMLDCRGDQTKIKTLFSSIAIVNIMQAAGFLVLFALFGRYIPSDYIWYLAVGIALNVFSGLLMQFARGIGKMIHYSIGSFVSATGTIVLNVIFLVCLKMGAHGMLLATLGGILANCVYLFFALKAWRYFSIQYYDGAVVRAVTKYALPMVPSQISGLVLSTSNRTIISWLLGVGANGVFTIANKFSSMVNTVYCFFDTAWVETVSVHFEDEDRDAFISDMMETALALFVSVCVGIIAVMPFAFPIMVDGEYGQAYGHIPILLIGIIFRILMGLYSAIYIALKKSREIAKTTIIGAIINVALHFALIKFLGLYAASIATMVSFAVVALQRRVDIRKYVTIKSNVQFVVLAVCAVLWVTVSYYINTLWLNVVTLCVAVCYAAYANRKILKAVIAALQTRNNKKTS